MNTPFFSHTAKFFSICIVTFSLIACGGGGSKGGGSGDPELSGNYSGTAGSSKEPISMSLSQSGTSVSGTVSFLGVTYTLDGSISGNSFQFTAQYKSSSVYCHNLTGSGVTLNEDRTAINGKIIVRNQNCDGTGSITGGTGSISLAKE